MKRHRFILQMVTANVLLVIPMSCIWMRRIEFRSPDGSSAIRILQRNGESGSGAGLQVDLFNAGSVRTIHKYYGDVFPRFFHAFWPKNDRVMLIGCSAGLYFLEYDVTEQEMVRLILDLPDGIDPTLPLPLLDSVRLAYPQYSGTDLRGFMCGEGSDLFSTRYRFVR